jgi:hypothetical protein
MPVPDYESGKGYYWMKQVHAARASGTTGNLPRKPRRGKAATDFFNQVDRRLSRQNFTVNIRFDADGKRIHDEQENIA